MTRDVITVGGHTSVLDAANLMLTRANSTGVVFVERCRHCRRLKRHSPSRVRAPRDDVRGVRDAA
ncbi:hypothetical protein [Bradyrhizobium sp.]|uniref:hypothetical protein n=1 Tax=Bradyrhizobium sp. TaxID=376 RepID=UPI00352DDADD